MSRPKITDVKGLISEYESGMSTVQLALKYNTSATVINGWIKRGGGTLRSLSDAHADFSGKNHPRFKGRGSYTKDGAYLSPDAKGYLRRIAKGHPLASPSGLVGEHVFQACLEWGVETVRGNDVHHKNGNKTDNSIGNLEVLPRRDHRRKESNFRGTVYEDGVHYCFHCRQPPILTSKSFSDQLKAHLLLIGGESMFGDQLDHDPDAKLILTGKLFEESRQFMAMEPHQCHWNVSRLYEDGVVDQIVIGYALNHENVWFQHTWGMREGTLVETSEINFVGIQKYFGAVHKEPAIFVELCQNNTPGSGKVRRLNTSTNASLVS